MTNELIDLVQYVLPNSSRTFHDKGAAQVDAVAKDKSAFTPSLLQVHQ